MTPGLGLGIDSLPAGRELDAMVAERVLGLAVLRTELRIFERSGTDYRYAIEHADCPSKQGGVCTIADHVRDLPPYSTDDPSALKVVGRMRDLEFRARRWSDGSRWEVHFVPPQQPRGRTPLFDGAAPTLALAICRAALKAVGWDSKQAPPPGSKAKMRHL